MQQEQNGIFEGFSSDRKKSDKTMDDSSAKPSDIDSSESMDNDPKKMMDKSGNINIPKLCKTLASKAKNKQKEGFQSIEGFDILGNESNLQRGKPSNCISVNKSSSSINVEPSESNTQSTMIYSKF